MYLSYGCVNGAVLPVKNWPGAEYYNIERCVSLLGNVWDLSGFVSKDVRAGDYTEKPLHDWQDYTLFKAILKRVSFSDTLTFASVSHSLFLYLYTLHFPSFKRFHLLRFSALWSLFTSLLMWKCHTTLSCDRVQLTRASSLSTHQHWQQLLSWRHLAITLFDKEART